MNARAARQWELARAASARGDHVRAEQHRKAARAMAGEPAVLKTVEYSKDPPQPKKVATDRTLHLEPRPPTRQVVHVKGVGMMDANPEDHSHAMYLRRRRPHRGQKSPQ